jgi:hypothetical protein
MPKKRYTICIDIDESQEHVVQKHIDKLHEDLGHAIAIDENPDANWDVCIDNVNDDEPEETESQKALIRGHLEEKGLA